MVEAPSRHGGATLEGAPGPSSGPHRGRQIMGTRMSLTVMVALLLGSTARRRAGETRITEGSIVPPQQHLVATAPKGSRDRESPPQ